jgi:hypothetical protein
MQKTDSIHGLLDPKNAGLVLVDFQPQRTFAAQSIHGQTRVNNAVGLARSAQITADRMASGSSTRARCWAPTPARATSAPAARCRGS